MGNKLQHGHLDADDGGTLSSAAIPANETGTWAMPSPSRAIDTVYQNTSKKKRRVAVTISAVGTGNQVSIDVGSSNPPSIIGYDGPNGERHFLTFEVPNNWYYRIATSTGVPSVVTWSELDE